MEQLKTIPLNSGQQAAAEGFMQFLFGPAKELCISGPGGVGKTYLMSYLIDQVMPQYEQMCQMLGEKSRFTEVVMTATTNKAAEVLAEATKRPTQTIHSFLNLIIKEDFRTGQTRLEPGKQWKVHHNKILFIDEASMIDTPLRNKILEGTNGCKIVYVGDHCQLSPIMEAVSPVYVANLPFFELEEQMRTTIPELQATNAQLRETVKTGVFKPIRAVPGIIDWLDGPAMEAEVAKAFAEQTHDKRILAYTYNRVKDYNAHIREMRGLGNDYTVGEFLINNSAVMLGNATIHVEEELEIIYQGDTEMIQLEGGVELEIIHTTLANRYNEVYRDVEVPVDRDHFDRLLKYYKSQKNWFMFYDLKKTHPDLRQRDAATVHKAQGSTYDTVFIDLDDLSTCRNPDQAARLLYVAFSRARRRVVCYGDLAEKFGGMTR
jgi:hypothetical protein